jgi:hypothetical protein
MKLIIDRHQRAEEILLCYKEQYKRYWNSKTNADHFVMCLGLNFMLSDILRSEGLNPETGERYKK